MKYHCFRKRSLGFTFIGGGGGGGGGGVTLMFMKQKAEASEQNTGFVHALSAVMWQLTCLPPPLPLPKKRKEKGTNTHEMFVKTTEIVLDPGQAFLSNLKNLSKVKWAMNSFCERFQFPPKQKYGRSLY